MTVTELAARVRKPRGTVAHHVDVLVDAGLLKVTATRRVRAIEERFYGRTAQTIMFPDAATDGDLPFVADARAQADLSDPYVRRRIHAAACPNPGRAGRRVRGTGHGVGERVHPPATRRRPRVRVPGRRLPHQPPGCPGGSPNDDATRLGASYRKLFISTTISNIGDGMSLIAYPWLASALTRNPLLISGVVLVQRLALAGVHVAGRSHHRSRRPQEGDGRWPTSCASASRWWSRWPCSVDSRACPGLDDLSTVTGTATGLYILLLVATLLLGTAEVLRDNCGQTFMPSIVENEQLEKANGRMWSAEIIANTFIGPPLGSICCCSPPSPCRSSSMPRRSSPRLHWCGRSPAASAPSDPMITCRHRGKAELAEGFRWLWANDLLRSMAIILGLMNLASTLSGSVLVLFAQEVLGHRSAGLHHHGLRLRRRSGRSAAPWRRGCRSGSAAAPAWR